MAVQVALVGEAGQAGDVGGPLAARTRSTSVPGPGRCRPVRKDVQALVPLRSVGSLPMITTYCTAGAWAR